LKAGRIRLHLLVQTDPSGVATELPASSRVALDEDEFITQWFDALHGQALILGEPAAGKTTLLLQLTNHLLDRAEHDPSAAIPGLFNLSSWGIRQGPLSSWLADELGHRYRVPLKLARGWVEAGQIVPLLDGLDEVSDQYRADCVYAINEFSKRYDSLSIDGM
jgi:predicted NACHT family NTPase